MQAPPATIVHGTGGGGRGSTHLSHSSTSVTSTQPARGARLPAEAHTGEQMAGQRCFGQQLQQRACPAVKPDVTPTRAVHEAAAEPAVCAIGAKDSQQVPYAANCGAADVSSTVHNDSVTSIGTGLTTTSEAPSAGWASWLTATGVQEAPTAAAEATQADVSRQALAWLSPPQRQPSTYDRTAVLFTTAD